MLLTDWLLSLRVPRTSPASVLPNERRRRRTCSPRWQAESLEQRIPLGDAFGLGAFAGAVAAAAPALAALNAAPVGAEVATDEASLGNNPDEARRLDEVFGDADTFEQLDAAAAKNEAAVDDANAAPAAAPGMETFAVTTDDVAERDDLQAALEPALLDDLLAPSFGEPAASSAAAATPRPDLPSRNAPSSASDRQPVSDTGGTSAPVADGLATAAVTAPSPRAHGEIQPLQLDSAGDSSTDTSTTETGPSSDGDTSDTTGEGTVIYGASTLSGSSGGSGGSGSEPTVWVDVTDQNAAEVDPEVGEFTIQRDDTSGSLEVFFTLGGTAEEGTDYATLGTSVGFADGEGSATLTVDPVDDDLAEGAETVVLTLSSDPEYVIGTPDSGTVYIIDDETAVDIDTDSDNTGTVDQTQSEDDVEEGPPGNFVALNKDDDNNNQVQDFTEGGPLQGTDDDLEPVELSFDSGGADLTDYKLTLAHGSAVSLWDTDAKDELPALTFTLGSDPVPPGTIYVEGIATGQTTVSWALRNPSGTTIALDSVMVSVVSVDVHVDSDNSGMIDGNDAEEAIEGTKPGKLVLLNDDDDNENGTADHDDSGPLTDPNGNPVQDDDLIPVKLDWDDGGADLTGFILKLGHGNDTELWTTQDKQAQVAEEFTIGIDTPPSTVYVEGQDVGENSITWSLHDPSDTFLLSIDFVTVTVINPELTAHRPQTPHFSTTAVPEAEELDPGVGIRRNGDDDDGNNAADNGETGVAGEDDLIQVTLNLAPLTGVEYVLERTNTNINVWDTSDKTNGFLTSTSGNSTIIECESGSTCHVWVEWATDTSQTDPRLKLFARDTTSGVNVLGDELKFFPFTSIVVGFVGEFQDPGDTDVGTHEMMRELRQCL